ncbi:hypothetical protein XA68_14091 [Ophiocordyceps unilateralis]|uniref:Uncharacterized protein n=1 Tax=Ophiocordyceps unilateralis TaxID=268505 RepID=A0A2A9P9Q6_OPHUN|nr:hypothetical protein XA68_14091 [Ophiocordyceps unilateralis]
MRFTLTTTTIGLLLATNVMASCGSQAACEAKTGRARIGCLAHWKACSASTKTTKTEETYNNPCGGNFASEPPSNHPLPDTLPHGCQYRTGVKVVVGSSSPTGAASD